MLNTLVDQRRARSETDWFVIGLWNGVFVTKRYPRHPPQG